MNLPNLSRCQNIQINQGQEKRRKKYSRLHSVNYFESIEALLKKGTQTGGSPYQFPPDTALLKGPVHRQIG